VDTNKYIWYICFNTYSSSKIYWPPTTRSGVTYDKLGLIFSWSLINSSLRAVIFIDGDLLFRLHAANIRYKFKVF